MDKTVIFAVAGSGKTTHIINQLNLENRSLVITYTNNNIKNLKDGIINKFGYFPSNVTLLTYFTFLYSFCFRPLLSYQYRTRGINYNRNPNRYIKQTELSYFIDKDRRIYNNRIAKFLELKGVLGDINLRLSKYFDNLFIDEIQDFAGNDFNFIKSISQADLQMTFLGDFYQHTFDTSRDGNVNKNLHNDYDGYKNVFKKMGMNVDCESLCKSHRCSPTICEFITNKIGIEIYSHRTDKTNIFFLERPDQAENIFKHNEIVKLFYKGHYNFCCYSRNWGDCKGENKYSDVCVVLNKTTFDFFKKGELRKLSHQTKNKLYVACSRARNDLYLVSEELYKKIQTKK